MKRERAKANKEFNDEGVKNKWKFIDPSGAMFTFFFMLVLLSRLLTFSAHKENMLFWRLTKNSVNANIYMEELKRSRLSLSHFFHRQSELEYGICEKWECCNFYFALKIQCCTLCVKEQCWNENEVVIISNALENHCISRFFSLSETIVLALKKIFLVLAVIHSALQHMCVHG